MLEYEKQIFLDILQEDGLVVAAKGLGVDSVILSLLKVYCDAGNLVFVLGAEGKHQEWLLKRLKASRVTPQPKVVSSDIGGAAREQSYLEGGLWFVPPTILVVDIIRKRVPVDLITGIIVCKAHKILKNHQAAFVLRLYRQGNKTGFIKAFSDQAPAFKGSFTKVEQILKALFLRNLLLWPRYHAVVKSSLNQCKPTVVELHLEMTNKMIQLQNALLDLIKQTVQELKRLNPVVTDYFFNKAFIQSLHVALVTHSCCQDRDLPTALFCLASAVLDAEDVTVENAISDAFHKVLHSQLDPVWHALSERTKTLLADLKLFHYMIRSLITVDSVSFYALVNSQRKSDRAFKGSGWQLLPSAEILFTSARQRVFPSSKAESFDFNEMDAEPHPKWLVLSEVLAEIHREFAKRKSPVEEPDGEGNEDVEKKLENLFNGKDDKSRPNTGADSPADILILTRDGRNCSQLQLYLTLGSNELLSMQYQKCFSWKVTSRMTGEGRGALSGKEEGDNAEAEDPEDKEDPEELDESKADCYTLSLSTCGFSQLESEKKVNIAGYFEDSLTLSQKICLMAEESIQTQSMSTQGDRPPPVIVIQTFNRNLFELAQILEDRKPQWVIMYDVEMTVVRQLEVYQRNNPGISLKVYFLVFGGTIEEQAYLTSLRKEKEAFDYLIEEKSKIVIPEDINDFPELCRDDPKVNELLSRTRKGGLESPKKGKSKIIVDIREFRSELPALIHARGIEIEPLFLNIGDYILTPDICLERKNVVDLISSLNSGRLYDQASAMTRHYSRPMLLIEFDKNKPFDLQDRYYLSTDASPDYIVTKLQVLTLHFPQLRLIWSPNPQATAELFEELKAAHPEPDSATALGVGGEEVIMDEDKFNVGVQKFLAELPGVTNKNINSLLRKGSSLDHLCTLTKQELSALVENEAEGEMLYGAFHERYEPTGDDDDEDDEDEDDDPGSASSKRTHNKPPLGRGKRKRFH